MGVELEVGALILSAKHFGKSTPDRQDGYAKALNLGIFWKPLWLKLAEKRALSKAGVEGGPDPVGQSKTFRFHPWAVGKPESCQTWFKRALGHCTASGWRQGTGERWWDGGEGGGLRWQEGPQRVPKVPVRDSLWVWVWAMRKQGGIKSSQVPGRGGGWGAGAAQLGCQGKHMAPS